VLDGCVKTVDKGYDRWPISVYQIEKAAETAEKTFSAAA
jgi:hypothetical protein